MKALFYLMIPTAIAVSTLRYTQSPTHVGIFDVLKQEFASINFFPGDDAFVKEVQVPWAAQTWVEPSCIFAPGNAKQLSFAFKQIASLGSQFAMRGGGHMPVASSHSISKGVLISRTNLDMLHLSKDKSILSIGPGWRWNDAFQFLKGTGRSVVGARSTHVGVPGYLLGGGISFYSYEYGLGSTNGNVKSYECVLADGKIVRATASNRYSDLFWALQAGGNSLCLVTRFELKTVHSPLTMIASPSYSSNASSEYIDSVFNYAINGHADPKGVVLPVIQYTSGASAPSYSATLIYNGNNTSPHILQDFLAGLVTPVNLNASNPLSPMSLGQYSRLETPVFEKGGQTYGRRQRFHLLPILAKRDAMQLVHDKYFEGARSHFNNTPGVGTGLAFNPITKHFLAAINAEPGALQGFDETPAL
ncbi:FAD linked oxidase, N-terminal [Penicillium expansum]|uniref:FAD linked oxidase, N-terminal n=1 Tax=Penicillium expansum TaxID=27334 RepID=A0A0A2JM68_PENEN|nr:FAD linked oxidase, N-terminal [Penicillium expansum]KGO43122.1 FAD linked oxidase, N-terminal [Penicillium expansum]KGO53835.1 FAD linked oxidase, N-terminal [Penicillium expansum]KGO56484.1 FAD linked oxidase, N-terminal [Penicillium expansum]